MTGRDPAKDPRALKGQTRPKKIPGQFDADEVMPRVRDARAGDDVVTEPIRHPNKCIELFTRPTRPPRRGLVMPSYVSGLSA